MIYPDLNLLLTKSDIMKPKAKNENTQHLIRIVYNKWRRKKVRHAALFKITDEKVLARMAIDRKLDGLTRVHALRMIEDKKLMGKIGLILHTRLEERFDEIMDDKLMCRCED